MIAALLALAAATAPIPSADPALDRACFSLMAGIADSEDARLRSVGLVAAQYFLGRMDAAAPGFDPDAAEPPPAAARRDLLRRCGEVMGEAGHDFRSIGERLDAEAGSPSI